MENLVGRQIKGFRFEGNLSASTNYINKIGVIVHQSKNKVSVKFDDLNIWQYPLNQIQEHLIPLEAVNVFKLGQKVWDMSISDEAGVVVRVTEFDFNGVIVDFIKSMERYKIDGINEHGQRTLASAPYKFEGFLQENIIERGTLVYFKNCEIDSWQIGFYDQFKSNLHWIFFGQQNYGTSLTCKYCQTENPLI